jgi:hypothetical protein
MAYVKQRSKFIQIAGGDEGVYALDEQGYVWYYWYRPNAERPQPAEWRQMSRRREGDAVPSVIEEPT